MRKVLFGLLMVALLIAIVVPVSAKSKDPVGVPISVIAGVDVEVTGPFHVFHGFHFDISTQKAVGKNKFVLEIDGVT